MLNEEPGIVAAKIAPAAVGTAWGALTLNEWVLVATLIYVLAQLGLLVPKYWALMKRRTGR